MIGYLDEACYQGILDARAGKEPQVTANSKRGNAYRTAYARERRRLGFPQLLLPLQDADTHDAKSTLTGG